MSGLVTALRATTWLRGAWNWSTQWRLSWPLTAGLVRTCSRRHNDQRSTLTSLRLLVSPPWCPCHPIILKTFSLDHWYSNKHQHNICVYEPVGTECFMCKMCNTMWCSKCWMSCKYICCSAALLCTLRLLVTWCTSSLTSNSCTFCPHCIYVFCIYLRTNSDLCHLQHKLIGFYNQDEKCLLCGTNWVFK